MILKSLKPFPDYFLNLICYNLIVMDEKSKNYFANLAGSSSFRSKKEPEGLTSEVDIEEEGISAESDLDQSIDTGVEIEAEEALAIKVETPKSKKVKTRKVESELDFLEDDFTTEPEGQLTVDVYQTEDDIVIQSTVAGVKQEDLIIDITGESVSIRGKRGQTESINDEDYFYQECYWGRFSRSIILPQEINPDKTRASLKDGILTIKLPKLERERHKKLRIKIT